MDPPLARLTVIARRLGLQYAHELEALAARRSEIGESGWLWRILLESWSTHGGSRGYEGLMSHPRLGELSYERMVRRSVARRAAVAEPIFREAAVRYPKEKAKSLAASVDVVKRQGGPDAARDALFRCSGAPEKIRFLRQYQGIGPKYARNILMTVVDPDLRHSIAVDARITKLARALGLSGGRAEIERALLQVAEEAGLEGWQLDRLIYGHLDEFLAALRSGATHVGVPVVPIDELTDGIAAALELDPRASEALRGVLAKHRGHLLV